MIGIKKYIEIGNMMSKFPPLESFVYGAADEDIMDKIQLLEGYNYPALVGLLPSIIGIGRNMDELGYESPLIFYSLVPIINRTKDELMDAWESTLEGINGVQKALLWYRNDPNYREIYNLKPDTIHIDPEYNMWGLMGWSISFMIEYDGIETDEGSAPY